MKDKLIPAHGGFRKLKSYQNATIVYDFTFHFCKRYIKDYRLRDQMVHAARSGRQNIAEGCQVSGTSKKSEMKLVSVARGSQEELLLDYEDYLRQHNLERWDRHDDRVTEVCALAWNADRSYRTYEPYIANHGSAANAVICLIHQTNYLLDRQLDALSEAFRKNGGFTERLYAQRNKARRIY